MNSKPQSIATYGCIWLYMHAFSTCIGAYFSAGAVNYRLDSVCNGNDQYHQCLTQVRAII